MARFTVTLVIETDTAEHAHEVVAERIHPEEYYGFEYTIYALNDLTES